MKLALAQMSGLNKYGSCLNKSLKYIKEAAEKSGGYCAVSGGSN